MIRSIHHLVVAFAVVLVFFAGSWAHAQSTMNASGPVNVAGSMANYTGSNLFFGAGTNFSGPTTNAGPIYAVAANTTSPIGVFQPDNGSSQPSWLTVTTNGQGAAAGVLSGTNVSQVTAFGAPAAVFSNQRYGGTNISYAFSGLTNGTSYNVVLLWADNVGAGSRSINVAINGTTVLTGFDPEVAAGATNTATFQLFTAAPSSGAITVTFSGTNLLVEALMVYPATPNVYAVAANTTSPIGIFQPDNGAAKPSWLTLTTNGQGAAAGVLSGTNVAQVAAFGATPGVFSAQRYGGTNISYAFSGLTNGTTYNVVLLWADNVGSGSRSINVAINGTTVLTGFDPENAAGATNVATFQMFAATPTSGAITVTFSGTNLMVEALMVYPATPNVYAVAANTTSPIGIFQPDNGTAKPSWLTLTTNGQGAAAGVLAATNVAQVAGFGASPAVFSAQRYGGTNISYAFSGLTNGTTYNVVLLWADNVGSGSRSINVAINGTTVLTGFDPENAAGATNVAISRSFPATPASGTITVTFSGTNLMVEALMVFPTLPPITVPAITTGGGVVPYYFANSPGGVGMLNYSYLPVISSISASTIPQSPTAAITITGIGFTGTTAVNFGSASVAPTTVSETSLTVVPPSATAAGITSAGGNVSVSVTAQGTTAIATATSTTAASVTYASGLPPVPASQIPPSTMTASGPVNVTGSMANYTGSNLFFGAGTNFSGPTANGPIYAVAANTTSPIGIFQPDNGTAKPSWLTLTTNGQGAAAGVLSGTNVAQVAAFGAPAAVFSNQRYGGTNISYAFSGLTNSTTYNVVLLWADNVGSGSRSINVAINGTTVLTGFDPEVAAGATNVATFQLFTAAPSSGTITVTFSGTNLLVEALMVYPATPNVYAVAANTTSPIGIFQADNGTAKPSWLTLTTNGQGAAAGVLSGTNVAQVAAFGATPGVFSAQRYGGTNISYAFSGLTNGTTYNVVLLWADNVGSGSRSINVAINGTTVLTGFDPENAAGATNVATFQMFAATPTSGAITVTFSGTNLLVEALMVYPATPNVYAVAAAYSGTTPIGIFQPDSGTAAPSWLTVTTNSSDTTSTLSISSNVSAVAGFGATPALFANQRWTGTTGAGNAAGAFTYTFSGLTANQSYNVVLLWADNVTNRAFNVSINGTQVLTNFNVGGTYGTSVATSRSFAATASSSGTIAVLFVDGSGNSAMVNALMVYPTLPPITPPPITTGGGLVPFYFASTPGGAGLLFYNYLPVISSISPNPVPLSPTAAITLTGNGFTGTTSVNFGSVSVTPTSVTETSITVVPPSAAAAGVPTGGTVNVSVTAQGTTATAAANSISPASITYSGPPIIAGISASQIPLLPSAVMTITGTNFTGATSVKFGSASATPTSVTATSLQVIPPSAALAGASGGGTVQVSVIAIGTSATTLPVTYLAVPTVTLTPASGPVTGGTSVGGSGNSFAYLSGATFAGQTAGISYALAEAAGASTAVGQFQPDATLANFTGGTVTNPVSTGIAYSVTPQAAAFGATPALFQGQRWTNTGTFTYNLTGLTTGQSYNLVLFFGENFATGIGQRQFNLAINGTQVLTDFDVFATALAQTGQGQYMGICESFTATAVGGAITLTFSSVGDTSGAMINGLLVYSSVISPAITTGGGVYPVALTTPGGTATTSYSYQPVVSSVTPSSGGMTPTTAVTITGHGFTGTTSVQFGSISVTPTTVSETSITVLPPAASAAGAVAVAVTAQGTSASAPATSTTNGSFTYLAPSISGVSPSSVDIGGGTKVTISGQYFTGATSVSLAGVSAASFTVVSDTQINAVTAATGADVTGPVKVSVGAVTRSGSTFIYGGGSVASIATVPATTPPNGPLTGNTTVVITGVGFTGATGVFFGNTAAKSFMVNSDTQITAVSPSVATAGPVNINVMVGGLDSSFTTADQFTYQLYFNYSWTTWSSLNWSTPTGSTITWNSQSIPVSFAMSNGFFSWYAPANAQNVNVANGAIAGTAWGISSAPYPWSSSSLSTNIAGSPGMDGPFANNDPPGNTGSIISGDWKDFATGQLSYYGVYSNANAWQNPVFWSYYNLLVSGGQLPSQYSITATTTTITNNAGYQYFLIADGLPSTPLGRTSYVGNSGMYYFNTNPTNPGNAKFSNGPFYQDSKTGLTDIPDGTSNTILFGESLGGADNALPTYQLTWMGTGTMPSYWDCQTPSQYFMFSSMHPGVVNFAFCDGSVRSVSKVTASVPPDAMGTFGSQNTGDGTNTVQDNAKPPAASIAPTARWVAFQLLAGINDNASPDFTLLGLTP